MKIIIVCSLLFFMICGLESLASVRCNDSVSVGVVSSDSIPGEVYVPTSSNTKRPKGFVRFVGKIIDFLSDFDSTYVAPNYYSLAAMVQATLSYHSRG